MRWFALLAILLCSKLAAAPITIGFGVNKPPYVIEAQAKGLEVDIVLAACRAAGLECQPQFYPQARMHALLARKAIDAIVTTNENSGLVAFYSNPYIEFHNYAVSLAQRKLDIGRIEDLANYSVTSFQRASVLLGPRFQAVVKSHPSYVEEAQQQVRNLLLLSGRVDVAVGDRRIIEYFNREVADRVNVKQALVWHDIFPSTPYQAAFAQSEHRDRFNQGLRKIRDNGEYAAIEARYANF